MMNGYLTRVTRRSNENVLYSYASEYERVLVLVYDGYRSGLHSTGGLALWSLGAWCHHGGGVLEKHLWVGTDM